MVAEQAATLKIEGARFIITMDTERRIIRDGSLMVRGNRIERVGKVAELAAVQADRVIDAREMAITPGFVNGHMHISYAHATRGIFPDSLGRAYLPNVFKLQSVMTPDEEYATSLLGITELIKYGTTCFVDPGSTKHIGACMAAYEQSGIRITTGTHVTDRPNPLNLPVYQTKEAVERMEEAIARFDGKLDGRVRAWAMPFSADYSTPELLQAAKGLADRYHTGFTLHQSYAPEAAAEVAKKTGKRPVAALEALGCLGPNVLLSHALGLDDSEIDLLARTDTAVVAVPTAAIKGGSGMTAYGKLPEMIDKGVRAALGTDAANNSNLVETMRSMYLIAVLYKDGRRDVQAIPAETALELATIRGAQALGLGDQIGSLEPGKCADLVLFDTRRPEWRTLFNPVNSLVYSADGRSVDTVIVDGRVVVENHTPLFVDEWELMQRVQSIGESMLERTGLSFPSRWPVV